MSITIINAIMKLLDIYIDNITSLEETSVNSFHFKGGVRV